jgi:hypothetical protein
MSGKTAILGRQFQKIQTCGLSNCSNKAKTHRNGAFLRLFMLMARIS